MESGEPSKRHTELSQMLYKMGVALYNEGKDSKDYNTLAMGNAIIFISSAIFDQSEAKLISQLVSMFHAKRLIRDMPEDMRYPNSETYDKIWDEIRKKLDERDNNEDLSDSDDTY